MSPILFYIVSIFVAAIIFYAIDSISIRKTGNKFFDKDGPCSTESAILLWPITLIIFSIVLIAYILKFIYKCICFFVDLFLDWALK